MTKKGYDISMTEAVEAFKFLMLEKIKKLARVAKAIERTMSGKLVLPETRTSFIEPLLKNTNGNMMTAAMIESMNKRVIGATPERIFWSIA